MSPDSLQDGELWARLEAFSLDDADAAFRFTARLASENGWSRGHARRVAEEYKRFLYLCARAGHPCTPSDAVDQAWHLHLCYTRSYWEDLCGRVLGQPLHHGPTRGGTAERTKFRDAYAATLRSYRQHFGIEPPPDLWPPVGARFAAGTKFRRVDLSRHLVLPRAGVSAAAGIAFLWAVLPDPPGTASRADLFGFMLVAGVILAATLIIRKSSSRNPRRRDDGGTSGGCGTTSGCGASGRNSLGDDSSDAGDNGGGGDSGCGGGGCGGGGD